MTCSESAGKGAVAGMRHPSSYQGYNTPRSVGTGISATRAIADQEGS